MSSREIPSRGLQLQRRSVVDSDERDKGWRWTGGDRGVVGPGGWGKTAPTPVYRPGYTLSRRFRKFLSLPALPLTALPFPLSPVLHWRGFFLRCIDEVHNMFEFRQFPPGNATVICVACNLELELDDSQAMMLI